MEAFASRLPALYQCVRLLPYLAKRRTLGPHPRCPPRTSAQTSWQRNRAVCGPPRQSVGQDHGKRGPKDADKTIGFDAGKLVKGRKRHLAVDTLGLLWALEVTAASVQDRDGGARLLAQIEACGERLVALYADGAYAGKLEDIVSYFCEWTLNIVTKLAHQKGFVVLPMRWIVERTLAWLNKNRRLSKDYEFEPKSSEAMIKWAMIAHMLRRLAPM